MVSAHKTDWDRKLPSAAHAYNISEKKITGQSSFFLVFGQEAVHGVELEVETLRVMAYWIGACAEDPEFRMVALQDLEEAHTEAFHRTISVQANHKERFDAKVPRSNGIQQGGLVLLYDNRHEQFSSKLHTRWMGPYRVTETFENGSLQLKDLQGNWLGTRVNGSKVKQYRPRTRMIPTRTMSLLQVCAKPGTARVRCSWGLLHLKVG